MRFLRLAMAVVLYESIFDLSKSSWDFEYILYVSGSDIVRLRWNTARNNCEKIEKLLELHDLIRETPLIKHPLIRLDPVPGHQQYISFGLGNIKSNYLSFVKYDRKNYL